MKLKLTKDPIGGMKLVTDKGELPENVFVKSWKRNKDSVTRVTVELICITDKDGKNW